MKSALLITDLHQQHGTGNAEPGQVRVYRFDGVDRPASFPHIRRDFYKIELLTTANGLLGYADQRVVVQGNALIFANPLIPYSWQRTAGCETGFVCSFNEAFITPSLRTGSAGTSPLFRVGSCPVSFPSPDATRRLTNLFEQMLVELVATYANKHDLLLNYVQLLIHEGLKATAAASIHQAGTSSARISTRFIELLNQQFPIVSPQHNLLFKNANEFARQLGVHTNHLNKALKETTGKTTTEHVADKLTGEARALLRHSDWTIAQIGYCLGFEHASNFNSFFKKQTGYSPNQYRRHPDVDSYPFD